MVRQGLAKKEVSLTAHFISASLFAVVVQASVIQGEFLEFHFPLDHDNGSNNDTRGQTEWKTVGQSELERERNGWNANVLICITSGAL